MGLSHISTYLSNTPQKEARCVQYRICKKGRDGIRRDPLIKHSVHWYPSALIFSPCRYSRHGVKLIIQCGCTAADDKVLPSATRIAAVTFGWPAPA